MSDVIPFRLLYRYLLSFENEHRAEFEPADFQELADEMPPVQPVQNGGGGLASAAGGTMGSRSLESLVNAGALDLIEQTISAGATEVAARKWWMGEFSRIANEKGCDLEDLAVKPADIIEVEQLIGAGELTDKLARSVFEGVIAGEGSVSEVISSRGLKVVSDDTALIAAIEQALAEQPDVAEKIKSGKVQAAGAIVGAVMKATQGQADAAKVRALLLQQLGIAE